MERLPNESKVAWQAFQDFLKMGTNRSVKALFEIYSESGTKRGKKRQPPPTTKYSTLGNWSSRYDWIDRANAYDAEQALIEAQKEQEKEEAEHIKELKAFRKAGDMAAVSSMSIASQTLVGNRKKINELLSNMQLPENPTPKESLEILMVMEKAQSLAEKAIAQKSQLEGFDKIAQYLAGSGY